MATKKTSIALGRDELSAAKKAAAAEGLSLSAFLTKLVRAHIEQQVKFAAMDRFAKRYAPKHRLTEEARASIEAEWSAPLKPVRSRRRRTAA
jgi:hypothetical protein